MRHPIIKDEIEQVILQLPKIELQQEPRYLQLPPDTIMVFLQKEDVMKLVIGTWPNCNKPINELVSKYGRDLDDFGWEWNKDKLNELCIERLWEIYNICKTSWIE